MKKWLLDIGRNFLLGNNGTRANLVMDDPPPDYRRPTTPIVTLQLLIASLLGLFAFISFSILLRRFPKLYASRKYRIPSLPDWNEKSLFGWLPVLYRITDQQVLEYAGLDAFVLLGFFKMSIKFLSVCCFLSMTIISPIRYSFTGRYDDGNDGDGGNGTGTYYASSVLKELPIPEYDGGNEDAPERAEVYLWMYVVFTFFFTLLALYMLVEQTKIVVKTRQQYLGRQRAITDRTIRLSGIPMKLRNEQKLKQHIEGLKIGKVSSITICREWGSLNRLFHYRSLVLNVLELKISDCPSELRREQIYSEEHYTLRRRRNLDIEDAGESINEPPQSQDTYESENHRLFNEIQLKGRPTMRTGLFGWFGEKVDAIDYLTQQLNFIDEEIVKARQKHYSPTPTAFITMDSVANAQMAAQALLDPGVHCFIARLAPAPHDIKWDHVCLSRKERLAKSYSVTIFIGLCTIFLILPVSYLATLLNIKTITKFWSGLAKFLEGNEWALNIVTGLLPYIFTLLNVGIPYLYAHLTSKQGLVSHSEEELSLVSKNFFYVFVDLFLVFTLAGTASTYWGYLSDTTKIAYQLAASVKELSLFYVDLIILQGIGFFPIKLLLVGSLIGFPFVKITCKTPRQRREMFNPPIFNFGLQLPQPIVVLIITIIYSVMSTKILASGLVYFIIGYYVYKYQLVYATDHLPHATGKVWPLVFRRVIMGLLLFQLTMAGTLAGFQGGWVLSSCLFPLPLITISFLWDFEKNYLPLSQFIALSSIRENERDRANFPDSADVNDNFDYPYLVSPLEGPMLE
ncbi:Csc1p Ecym_4167 [Eremothecium cymbalariae DBVPG|uniref:CSC1/OSCA1-like 7TM region domain-containing protein n=1 Tax=Eremothecium cymbalariae (strain CBS 270.75 / DBVPG 7215 / KCTC 17166 / NRRL Y-17582) TaxID=931890 RepID=G8JT91_ERECY|nr:hypothetical protein Ecym_4167 [Eremothecium cymbalariae DBVPG\